MLQEFDINLDLTVVFILRKFYPVVQTLAQLNTFGYIYIYIYINYWRLKKNQYGEFKTRLKFTKLDWFKFI